MNPYIRRATILVSFVNIAVLAGAIIGGISKEPISFYFKEREIVTFMSALQLGGAALLAFVIYMMKKNSLNKKGATFWVLCSLGFVWLMADEWFMIHEGIDDGILGAFGFVPEGKHFLLDWVVIAAYGTAALSVCILFWDQIKNTGTRFAMISLGAVFYVGTTAVDAFATGAKLMILEESLKLIAVAFFFLFFITSFLETLQESSALPAQKTFGRDAKKRSLSLAG